MLTVTSAETLILNAVSGSERAPVTDRADIPQSERVVGKHRGVSGASDLAKTQGNHKAALHWVIISRGVTGVDIRCRNIRLFIGLCDRSGS